MNNKIKKLFKEQAITISVSGSEVTISCKNIADAREIFEYLFEIIIDKVE